jgi:hypothetical protein
MNDLSIINFSVDAYASSRGRWHTVLREVLRRLTVHGTRRTVLREVLKRLRHTAHGVSP